MYKRIIGFVLIVMALFAISFNLHTYFNAHDLSFSLFYVYLFHVVSAILVYFILELIASKLPNQAGYAYLMAMFFKIGAFVIVFQQAVFAKEQLLMAERVALVIPLFLFLIVEAVAVAKLLNSK
ncbi:DUF6168 family protein [Mariniflexile sp. AS56]|uniref:DUF6168 family protein n=1 Tax=Mariniflexile sp. AS56 TaxID=3063957 RepID=UPI0026EA0F89|nr:DUF6168 family protein [Mariniflexile sp. AS56]MDO7172181.1 DUF6168 family protein [Mariniflexile sp. AS56]